MLESIAVGALAGIAVIIFLLTSGLIVYRIYMIIKFKKSVDRTLPLTAEDLD